MIDDEDFDKLDRELRPEYACPQTGNRYKGEWLGDVKDGHGI